MAIVYQTTVAPGPFRLTDLYTTGSAGNLTMIIKEANRDKQHLLRRW
ncbi:fimbria/pilus outer membrane usher protein [Photorhabdus hainanensis]|nr:fimbria/pilus outer membrane usher protein [Photorhabdus hainanensis]